MRVEITPALLSDLRQKAEAATPGPWKVIETPRPDYSEDLRIVPCDAYGNSRGDGPIGDVFGGYKRPVAENAAHIAAASPAVVLALVAEIERLRSFQAVAVEVIDKLNNYHECSDPDQCRSCDQINAGIEAISKAKREASNDY